ncbi:hypothetical protein [Candidatus Cardinium hertigii]|nr:hypothetical protein [Candidatus Cardinium hertigii]
MQNLSLKSILSLLFLSTAMLACNSSKASCNHSKTFSIVGAAELTGATRTAEGAELEILYNSRPLQNTLLFLIKR